MRWWDKQSKAVKFCIGLILVVIYMIGWTIITFPQPTPTDTQVEVYPPLDDPTTIKYSIVNSSNPDSNIHIMNDAMKGYMHGYVDGYSGNTKDNYSGEYGERYNEVYRMGLNDKNNYQEPDWEVYNHEYGTWEPDTTVYYDYYKGRVVSII